MKQVISSFGCALSYLFKDKKTFLLSLMPVIIGIIFYSVFGAWFFSFITNLGEDYIKGNISSGVLGEILLWPLMGLVTVVFFFLTNWTFVLLVSLIASPFNDMISSRVEQLIGVGGEASGGSSILKSVLNELKKISLILFFSLLAAILNIIPFLAPLSFIMLVILLSVQFLDYNWSRHSWSFKQCIDDVKKHFVSYLFSGMVFMFFITIPLVNLLVLPYAVIYYTVLWSKLRETNR